MTASNTIDLAAYLEKSILAGKGSKTPRDTESKRPAPKTAAKKAAKKVTKKVTKKAAKKSA